MEEFVNRYVYPLMVAATPILLAWIVALLKQAAKDRKANAEACRALLYDKLKHLCEKHIREGYACLEDRKNLECLHRAYNDLDGNGFIDGLFTMAEALPIEQIRKEGP